MEASSIYEIEQLYGELIEIKHPHGSLVFRFDSDNKWFMINDLDVEKDFRRQGNGQNLLRYSLELAQDIGAKIIMSAIVSRKHLDVNIKVFGRDSVTIFQVGTYEDSPANNMSGTSAILWHDLNN